MFRVLLIISMCVYINCVYMICDYTVAEIIFLFTNVGKFY